MQTSEQQRARDDAFVHAQHDDREREAPTDDERDSLDGADRDDAQQYDHYGDEEDDDFVHRSWPTEHGGGEVDDSEHARAVLYERDYHRQDPLEYSDDVEDDDDDSADEELLELHFRNERGAARWTLPAESDDQRAAPTQSSMERVEANVCAAVDRIHGAKSHSDSGSSGDKHESDDANENDPHNEHEGDDNNAETDRDDKGAGEDGFHDDDDEWGMGYGGDGKPFYYDIVHEAMEARWSHASSQHSEGYDNDHASNQNGFVTDDLREHDVEHQDEYHDGSAYEQDTNGVYDAADDHTDEKHRADEDQEHGGAAQDEQHQQHGDDMDTKDTAAASAANEQGFSLSYFTNSNLSTAEDEWQEAYTAKGRVYYYNRRTRESSWKKPENFVSRPQQQHSDFAASSLCSLSRSSTLYTNIDTKKRERRSSYSIETQNFVFCSFCGDKLVVGDGAMKTHFRECQVQTFHKQNQTELYKKFEEMLCVMSEDSTLRSLHYASSFPDAKSLVISASLLENYKAQVSTASDHGSIQDNLFLLRRQHHHSNAQSTEETSHSGFEYKESARHITSAPQQPRRTLQRASSAVSVPSSESTSTTSSRRETSAGSANDVVGTNRSRKQAVGYTYQESETCRYCGRSFAEGRLAKHEAVCPRVFGNEGPWGRGTSMAPHVPPTTPRSLSTSPFAKRSGVQSKKKTFKSTPIEKRNLELSYKEHQATLVGCPVCKRKFAPSGAQQHIAICKSVQNRPKNPIPLLKDYAIAGWSKM